MHKSTKITPILRKEIFKKWSGGQISQRQLAREYHVDKRIIGKIIERGKNGDFTVHSSINKRYLKTTKKTSRTSSNTKSSTISKSRPKKTLPAKTSKKKISKRKYE